MKLLTQEEWRNKSLITEATMKSYIQLLDRVYITTMKILSSKRLSREHLGISMTFYHYFTYSKLYLRKDIDKLQMVVVCVYLSCITTNQFIKIENIIAEYNRILKISGIIQSNRSLSKQTDEVLNLQYELLNFLGFDVGIDTPYTYVNEYCVALGLSTSSISTELMNCSLNIINDIYRSDLCVYYPAKQIALSSLCIALSIVSDEEILLKKFNRIQCQWEDINELMQNHELKACMKDVFVIFEFSIGDGGYKSLKARCCE